MALINLIVNAAPAQTREIPNGCSVRHLVTVILGLVAADVLINGHAAALDTVLAHGDEVKVTGRVAPVQAPAMAAAPGYGAGTLTILFINNDGQGFADNIPVPAGQTIAGFLASRGYQPRGNEIRVNGQPVAAGYVLNNGDRVSVTPLKVQGANGGLIRVLYLNNQGEGFADHFDVISGITLGQFFSQRTGGGNPGNYEIRVNGQPSDRAYVLREGDRVSVTPTKVQGA